MVKYPNIIKIHTKIPGYEIFQRDLEINFPSILKNNKSSKTSIDQKYIKKLNIVLIGAWRGEEIRSFLKWPNSHIYAFEPNPENFEYLHSEYADNGRVTTFKIACSNSDGNANLFQASITGNDSLLQIQERDDFKLVRIHKVETKKLDSISKIADIDIDLLWVDVQGFEKYVIAGAIKTLQRVKAVYIELNDDDHAYQGATRVSELNALLEQAGFYMAHKEFDEVSKTGVGLFLKNGISTDLFEQKNIDIRIKGIIRKISLIHLLIGLGIYKMLGKILPISIKSKIKTFIT